MRVLILGGTGSVGQLILRRVLARGHGVTMLAREPARVTDRSQSLEVVEGDALDASSIDRAIAGRDAVISALGAGLVRRTTLFSDSTRILIERMNTYAVRRLIVITGVGAGDTRGHGGFLYDRLIYPFINKGVYTDKDRQETLIKQSALAWTIVRPASFSHKSTTVPLDVVVQVSGVKLCWITREEVASFVVDELERNQFVRQAVFIGHRC